MKERPILMNGAMVRATLDGRKTQTRRAVKVQSPHWKRVVHVLWGKLAAVISCRQPVDTAWVGFDVGSPSGQHYYKCPYGQPGDRLWVRETWGVADSWLLGGEPVEPPRCIAYRSDLAARCFDPEYDVNTSDWGWSGMKWKPSIHMPRWASRILLEIVSVRVERLQDISEEDAKAEGVELNDWYMGDPPPCAPFKHGYSQLWESINGLGSWDANPYVWVIEFRRIKP